MVHKPNERGITMIVKKAFSVKPDEDSTISKKCWLELTIPEGTTMQDLARAVLASEVIKVQAKARKKFDTLTEGHVFKKTFSKPGLDIDPIAAIIEGAKAAGMTIEDYLAAEIAKRA